MKKALLIGIPSLTAAIGAILLIVGKKRKAQIERAKA